MRPGIYYIAAKNSALNLFTSVTTYDLCVLELLGRIGAPCPYKRLYDAMHGENNTIKYITFTTVLKRGIANGYITRSQIGCNVLYCITTDGKMLLHRFSEVLERIVADKVRKYGNGLDLE